MNAMDRKLQREFGDNYLFVEPEEMPTAKLFIQARRSSFEKQEFSDPEIIEVVLQKSQIESFLSDKHLKRLQEISSPKKDLSFESNLELSENAPTAAKDSLVESESKFKTQAPLLLANGREKSVEELPQDIEDWVHLIVEIIR